MEFEELQQVWTDQPAYDINEKALYQTILRKKAKANHITDVSELLNIVVNFGVGAFVFWLNFFSAHQRVFLYVLAAWMLMTGSYVLTNRRRRIIGARRFDRSVRGDLDYAISVASYQVRFSRLMRLNIIPIAAITLSGLWDGGKSQWIVAAVVVFVVSYFAGGMEHSFYKRRRDELDLLRKGLEGV